MVIQRIQEYIWKQEDQFYAWLSRSIQFQRFVSVATDNNDISKCTRLLCVLDRFLVRATVAKVFQVLLPPQAPTPAKVVRVIRLHGYLGVECYMDGHPFHR